MTMNAYNDTESPVMTLSQTAEYLQISKAHLSNVIHGKVPNLPPIKHANVGRRTLVKKSWADAWLDELVQ